MTDKKALLSELIGITGDLRELEALTQRALFFRDKLIAAALDHPETTGVDVARAADLTEGRIYALGRRARSIVPASGYVGSYPAAVLVEPDEGHPERICFERAREDAE